VVSERREKSAAAAFFGAENKRVNGGPSPSDVVFLAVDVLHAVQRRLPESRAVTVSLRSRRFALFFPMPSDPMPAFAAGNGAFRSSAAARGRTLARKLR
jgi:hypothetical protein